MSTAALEKAVLTEASFKPPSHLLSKSFEVTSPHHALTDCPPLYTAAVKPGPPLVVMAKEGMYEHFPVKTLKSKSLMNSDLHKNNKRDKQKSYGFIIKFTYRLLENIRMDGALNTIK